MLKLSAPVATATAAGATACVLTCSVLQSTCSLLQSMFAVCCTEQLPLDPCICNEVCVQNVLPSKLCKTYLSCCLCSGLLPCLTRGTRHYLSNRKVQLVTKHLLPLSRSCLLYTYAASSVRLAADLFSRPRRWCYRSCCHSRYLYRCVSRRPGKHR